jgi:molybdenum cofactor cytidylyltransferase
VFEGIVLAAGRSHRAGTFKPAHLHAGRPLLLHAAGCLLPWCMRVVVVGGHRHQEVTALLAGRPRLALVRNEAYDRGMLSSVQVGVGSLDPGATGFFVLPADCPLVGTEVPGEMIRAFLDHGARRPVVPVHEGRGGHPVLLPGAARALVLAAAPPATLRDVLRRLSPVRLPVDQPAVLMDLDRGEDLAGLAKG